MVFNKPLNNIAVFLPYSKSLKPFVFILTLILGYVCCRKVNNFTKSSKRIVGSPKPQMTISATFSIGAFKNACFISSNEGSPSFNHNLWSSFR